MYSNAESIQEAVNTKKGVYFSRKRGLWRKGETSGNEQVQHLSLTTVYWCLSLKMSYVNALAIG